MRHTSLKIFSLLIAVVLWLYVQSESNTVVRSFIAPVELKNIPDGMVITSPNSPSVEVTVRGPSFIVNKIPSSPPIFTIFAPGGVASSYTAQLTENDLDLLPRVSVVSIEPSSIKFDLEKLISKELNIRIPKLGSLPTDLSLSEIVLTPTTVKVSGPESVLGTRSFIEAEPIDLANISQSERRVINLRAPSTKVKLERDSVLAEIGVSVVKKERTFDLPIRLVSGDTEKEGKLPSPVNILIKGPKSLIESLTVDSLSAYVDLEEMEAGNLSRVIVKLPENIELVSSTPEMYDLSKILIAKKATSSRASKR